MKIVSVLTERELVPTLYFLMICFYPSRDSCVMGGDWPEVSR